jgi:hypothetical protein
MSKEGRVESIGQIGPERNVCAFVRRMQWRSLEFVRDVVEELVAVEDDVGLIHREDRTRDVRRIRRQVAMPEHRDESRDLRKLAPGPVLGEFRARRAIEAESVTVSAWSATPGRAAELSAVRPTTVVDASDGTR